MKIENKIALRYIFSKKGTSFVSIINLLSIIGITVGVAALIFVVSILSGFQEMNYKQILGYDPHVRIVLNDPDETKLDELTNNIKNSDAVKSYAFSNEKKSAVRKGDNIKVVRLSEISPADNNYTNDLEAALMYGSLDRSEKGIVIGADLAKELDVRLGSEIELITPGELERSARLFRPVNGNKYEVAGVFFSNIKDYDSKQVYSISDNINQQYLDVKLHDYESTNEFIEQISSYASDNNIISWKQMNEDFYDIMQFEKIMTIIILSLIILISAFNLLASLSMTIVQKKKDIAILKAIGLSKVKLNNIFRNEGLIIGSIGTFLGSSLGLILVYLQSYFGLIKFGSGITIESAFPIRFEILIFIAIVIISITLSYLSTILPIRRINKMNIIDGLRD